MRLPMTKYVNTTLTIIIVPQTISPFYILLLVRLGVYMVNLCSFYFYRLIGKLTVFFATSGVQIAQSNNQFHYRCTVFSSELKSRVRHILVKTSTLRIRWLWILIVSTSHTHLSHSQTSRPLTSSLSLGVPVPHSPPHFWSLYLFIIKKSIQSSTELTFCMLSNEYFREGQNCHGTTVYVGFVNLVPSDAGQ